MSSTGSNETDLDKGKSNLESIQTSGNENSLVFTKRKDVLISRKGRGYSKREIATAFANSGIGNQNISKIRGFHIPVDGLRRSNHPENVNKLEAILNVRLKSIKANNRTKKRIQTKEEAAGAKKK
jgi:ribosomal protein L13E